MLALLSAGPLTTSPWGLSGFCLLAVVWLNVACPCPRFSALLATLLLGGLFCFGGGSFPLSGNFFPRPFASSYSGQQFFVILRFTLFAKVLGRGVVVGQAHAVIVLPCFAVIAANHSSLRLFFLFITAADAAYDRVFFVIIDFCPCVGFGAFPFPFALITFLFANVSILRILAFGRSSRAAELIYEEYVVSFTGQQANT